MYKVCFDEDNKIIGFNIDKCMSYINLFDITHVSKKIKENRKEDKLDSIGRRIFKKINKITKTRSTHFCTSDCNFEDNDYTYEKEYNTVEYYNEYSLLNESNMFTEEDIVNEKKKQLQNKFEANGCLIIELFNSLDEDIKLSNCVLYKDYLKVNNKSEICINFKLETHKEILIYCESNNDLKFLYNENEVNNNEYIKHRSKNVELKIESSENADIYSIAILFR